MTDETRKSAKRIPKPELTFADIRRRKTGRISRVTIQLDGDVASSLEALYAQWEEAKSEERTQSSPGMDKKMRSTVIAREIEQLVEGSKETEAVFAFKAISRAEFDKVMASCPPTEKDKELARKVAELAGSPYVPPEWSAEDFPPAIITACSLEPIISPAEAVELWNDENWNGAELLKLYTTALMVNNQASDVPFAYRGIGATRSTGSKSNAVSSMASREVSSSDE